MLDKLTLGAPLLATLLLFTQEAQAGTAPLPGVALGTHPTTQVVSGCTLHLHCKPKRIWVPATFEQVERQVWVEARTIQVWVEAVYATRYDYCGRPYQVLVQPGHFKATCEPGHFETVVETVCVPAHWGRGCQPVKVPTPVYPGGYGKGHPKHGKPFGW